MKKQQVLFINGGDSKDNYKNYRDYLEKIKYDPYKEKFKFWKYSFVKDLGDKYFVINPEMPNKDFADYDEWKIMFEKTFPFLENDIILVGHSMGATFLSKYINENSFPVKIKNFILISGAFNDSPGDVIGNFNFDKKLTNVKKYEDKMIFFHSLDDIVVAYSDLEDFRKIFPKAEYNIFENRGHFIDETFVELIERIKFINL